MPQPFAKAANIRIDGHCVALEPLVAIPPLCLYTGRQTGLEGAISLLPTSALLCRPLRRHDEHAASLHDLNWRTNRTVINQAVALYEG